MTRHLGLEEIPDPGAYGRGWAAFAGGRAAEGAERVRAEQARREREAREAAERARRAREEKIRRIKESWNQGLTSYRDTEHEQAARFVLKKLGLTLDDDRVGEHYHDKFWEYSKTVPEIGQYFIDIIADTFDGYKFKRYEKLFSHLSRLFGDSKETVRGPGVSGLPLPAGQTLQRERPQTLQGSQALCQLVGNAIGIFGWVSSPEIRLGDDDSKQRLLRRVTEQIEQNSSLPHLTKVDIANAMLGLIRFVFQHAFGLNPPALRCLRIASLAILKASSCR